MTHPLATSVQGAVGQPSSVRVGTITSINPLVLSVQGSSFQGSAVGVLGSYVPQVGDNVSVVGQSSSAGSDPTSWLILGATRSTGDAIARVVSAFSAAANTTVALAYAPCAPAIGVSFTTNSAGQFLVHWRTGLDNTAADTKGAMSWEVREGGAVGVGTVVIAASDNMVIGLRATDEAEFGATSEIQSLSPYTTYNIQLMISRQVGTGTAAFARSGVTVQPVYG